MRKIYISLFTLILCSSVRANVCEQKLALNTVKESIDKCLLKNAVVNANKIRKVADSQTAFLNFCQLVIQADSKASDELCKNPAKMVCQHSGRVLDSKCSYTPKDEEIIIDQGKYKNIFCKEKNKKETTLLTEAGKKDCTGLKLEGDQCLQFLRFRDDEDDKNDFNKAIFTNGKVDRLFNLGEKVKNHYRTLIKASSKLSDAKKKVLIKRIEKTNIYVNQDRFENPELSDCYGSNNGKLSSGVFNTKNAYGNNEIHFCSGFAMNMQYMNPNALLHIMAHEFAHSIDPCALEQLQEGSPYDFKKYYSDTVACLRGTKDGNCKESELNCSGKNDLKNYCKGKYPNQWRECKKALGKTPSCVIGTHSHDGHYQQEQINEGFSDFMASEVLGLEMQDATAIQRADTLIAVTTQLSHRHDGCNQGKRTNSHPNVYQRVNTIMMSSEKGRKAIGCDQEGKKTCKSL